MCFLTKTIVPGEAIQQINAKRSGVGQAKMRVTLRMRPLASDHLEMPDSHSRLFPRKTVLLRDSREDDFLKGLDDALDPNVEVRVHTAISWLIKRAISPEKT